MTFTAVPWAVQGTSTDSMTGRQLVQALLGGPVATVSPSSLAIQTAGGAHGVVGAGDLLVAQHSGTPNMSVDVAVGFAFIRNTQTASLTGGDYFGINDAVFTATISAADSTNNRIDLVVAKTPDANYGDANSTGVITVVTGTAAASPVAPTPPANCLVLASVAVGHGVTSILNANITDLRTRATALGGIHVCTSTSRPSGASLFAGLTIYETDTNRVMVYNGSAWRGIRSVAFANAGGAATTSGTTQLIATALTVPDQGCAGTLYCVTNLYITKTVSTDVFYGQMLAGASLFAQSRADTGNSGIAHFVISGSASMTAGSGVTINSAVQRQSGTGTASFFSDPTLQRIDATFIPSA